MSDAFTRLLHSRKFLLAALDAGVSILLYAVGRLVPDALPDANFLIVTLQPVILIVIAAYAYEDAQIKAALAAINRKAELDGTNQIPRAQS